MDAVHERLDFVPMPRGTVVHQDDLQIGVSLRRRGRDGLVRIGTVVKRDDDGNGGLHRGPTSLVVCLPEQSVKPRPKPPPERLKSENLPRGPNIPAARPPPELRIRG